MKLQVLIIIFFLLGGCAPGTAQGLRDKYSGKFVFKVDENYQSVYRKIVTQARNHFQTGLITAQMVVQGDIYTDIKSGNVTIALHGGLGVDTYMTIDINALSDNQTRVTTYYALGTWESSAKAVEEWVKEDQSEMPQLLA